MFIELIENDRGLWLNARVREDMTDFQDWGHTTMSFPDLTALAKRMGYTPIGPMTGGRGSSTIPVAFA